MEQTSDPYVWRATLVASSYLPRGQTVFKITDRGIADIPEEKEAQNSPKSKKKQNQYDYGNRVHVWG